MESRFLNSLFAPLSFQSFLDTVFTREFYLARGDSARFEKYCTLQSLLGSLQSPQLPAQRVTLVKNGVSVDPKNFVQSSALGQLDYSKVKANLADQAALLLTGAHDFIRPLGELAGILTRGFAENVNINIYFGGPNSVGFPLHVDHHDVLVLQVLGSKRWTVYPPTLPDPIALPEHLTQPPQGAPAWEGQLEAGDVLYLPRGYWHCAHGSPELGTLHLACGIQPLTGLHFLTWLRQELMDEAIFRKNVPLYAAGHTEKQYISQLKNALDNRLTPKMLERFIAQHQHKVLHGTSVEFPESTLAKGEKEDEEVRNE